MKEIVAIGPMSPPINGPGIKNRHLKAGLIDQGIEVHWIDTHDWKNPKTIINILKEAWKSDAFLLSGGTKLRLLIGPILATSFYFSDSNGVLLPVGSRFPTELENLPPGLKQFYLRVFGSFDIAFCESDRLTKELQEVVGDKLPVQTLPNLRPKPETIPDSTPSNLDGPLRIVYVGRIKRSKGLSDLLRAIHIADDQGAEIEMDIHGHFLPNDSYEMEFKELCKETPGATYSGKIPDGDVIDQLRTYDVFAFPSYYEGEGISGAVIEALLAGCAVVASQWNYNDEIVIHEYNGILFEPQNVEQLADVLVELYKNPDKVEQLKINAWEGSNKYSAKTVSADLIRKLEDINW